MVDRARRAVRGIAGASLLLVALLAPTAAQAATNNIFTVAADRRLVWRRRACDRRSALGSCRRGGHLGGGYLIAENTKRQVRRVSPGGTITTVAGTTAGSLGRRRPGDRGADRRATRPSWRRRPTAGLIAETAPTTASGASRLPGRSRRSPAPPRDSRATAGRPPPRSSTSPPGGVAVVARRRLPDHRLRFNHRVRRVDAQGTITTVAGTSAGLSGDGGLAVRRAAESPRGAWR